jgi:N-acetyl-anhydromuramyl-L-alanine amidase AmpD
MDDLSTSYWPGDITPEQTNQSATAAANLTPALEETALTGMTISPTILSELTDRSLDMVTYVVIHHTADDSQQKDITEIAREEEASQGFLTVGYHVVIQKDGKVQYGRPIGKVPAANLGLNTVSYAISLEGNFHPPDRGYCGEVPSEAQIHAAIRVIQEAKEKLPNAHWLIGHRDVATICNDSNDATACPGDLLQARLHDLRVATSLHTPPCLL